MNDKSQFDNIPSELKKLKQWVCWGGDKLPKNPKTGKNAKSNDPQTWADFDTAVKAIDKYLFDGIGFMFDKGYFGVDLDNSSDELNDEFISQLKSYAEYSKSGKGIHVICRGKLPKGRRRKGNIEMYDSGRYFIMTGNQIGDYDIRDCTEEIKPLHDKYLNTEKRETIQEQPQQPVQLTDDEVISKARNSKNGMLFQVLFSGNWENFYPSQSEADMALCNMLAFWTGKNEEQMDRIFRQSNLYRDKWDRKQSGTTYGHITILNAIQNTGAVYNPNDTNYLINKHGEVVKKSNKNYQLNDSGNAHRLVDNFYGLIKYNHENKNWIIWNGKRWKVDNTGEVRRLADRVIDEMKVEAFLEEDEDKQKEKLKNVNRAYSSRGKDAMIKEATHLSGVPVLNQDFDLDKDLLNTQSGILNLRNGELIPHNPEYFQSKITGCEYQEGEEPKRWLKFLDEVTDGDKELVRFIQKAVGYSMTGSVIEQCMFFLYGTGRNGKSVFLEVMSELMGLYGTHTQPETIMYKNQSGAGATSEIARLKGARYVTTIEPNEGVRLNEGLIKQLTGGDKVTARHLYGREFEFYPEFKLWLATNHKPIIRGTDEGIWRRIRLIPFTVKIPEHKVDKYLIHRLKKELPLILNWAYKGCQMWQKEGLDSPKAVQEATKEYRNEMDIVNSFIEDTIMEVEGHEEQAYDIYRVYSKWANENNEYEMSATKFGREFSKRYKRKRNSKGTAYLGIKLKDSHYTHKNKGKIVIGGDSHVS